jgi:RNA polymerase sigma-70 factor (ECF subfamily)
MHSINDQDIIEKVLKGDTHAFSQIVDCYKDMVFTLSLQMMKDRDDAEEVAQRSFIKLYKKLKSFKGKSKFSSWIYRITYNTCLDELRNRDKSYKLVQINEYTENELKTIENVLDHMQSEELSQTIKNCLEQLPGEMGFILNLYYYEDFSINDIAESLGLKPNNAKVKLHRARLKLTEILKHNVEPEIIERYGN